MPVVWIKETQSTGVLVQNDNDHSHQEYRNAKEMTTKHGEMHLIGLEKCVSLLRMNQYICEKKKDIFIRTFIRT